MYSCQKIPSRKKNFFFLVGKFLVLSLAFTDSQANIWIKNYYDLTCSLVTLSISIINYIGTRKKWPVITLPYSYIFWLAEQKSVFRKAASPSSSEQIAKKARKPRKSSRTPVSFWKIDIRGGTQKNGNFVITSLFLNIFTPNFYHPQSILPWPLRTSANDPPIVQNIF